jgi:hypothetical protein
MINIGELDKKEEEIMNQLSYIGSWDGRFIVPIPKVSLYHANGIEIDDATKLGQI